MATPSLRCALRRANLALVRSIGRVTAGGGRETIPDFQIVHPLVNRLGGAAVEIREDAVDGRVIDPHVGPVTIRDHVAVDGHPDAAVGSTGAVPEYIELEPFAHGHGSGAVVHSPEYLVGKAAVGYVVALDLPIQRNVGLVAAAAVLPRVNVSGHAIIAGGLPLEDSTPVLGSHLLDKIGLEFHPEADIEVALFAGRL